MIHQEQNLWLRYADTLLSDTNISFLVHIVRSLFHLLFFITGLAYSFYQPLFLNFEVWTFIYCISGVALSIDTYIFLVNKKFNRWMVIHFLDALFIALIIYKTGYLLFTFFYFTWLCTIVSAGLQFRLKGALLQGLWVSCLFSLVQLLSPQFETMSTIFFILNTSIVFVTVGLSAWMGCRYRLFKKLLRFLLSPILKFLDKEGVWQRPSSTPQVDMAPTSTDAWDIFLSETDSKYDYQNFDTININLLIQEVFQDLTQKHKVPSDQICSQLKSSHEVLIHKKKLKVALLNLMKLFTTVKHFCRFHVKTYDKVDWVVIEFTGSQTNADSPFWLFNSVSRLFFIHKVINEHKGRLFSDKEVLSIHLPRASHLHNNPITSVS